MQEINCKITNIAFEHFGRCTKCVIQARLEGFHLNTNSKKAAEIMDWMLYHPSVRMVNTFKHLSFEIQSKAIRSAIDKDNEKIGEQIAESRAREKLYRFCKTLFKQGYKLYYAQYENCHIAYSKYAKLESDEAAYKHKLLMKA